MSLHQYITFHNRTAPSPQALGSGDHFEKLKTFQACQEWRPFEHKPWR